MPHRSKVMAQTKRDTLVLKVGGGGVGGGQKTTPVKKKKLIVTKVEQRKNQNRLNDNGRKKTRYTEITLAIWNVQTVLRK